jgi:DNA-binding MarR family transcriptional regulator
MSSSVIGLRISGSRTPARAALTAAGSITVGDDGTRPMVLVTPSRAVALGSEGVTELPPLRATDWRIGVWRSYLRTHGEMVRRLESDLVAGANMALGWYDVLLQLAEADGHRLRMAELADRVLLSRSGLTRLVDRLAAEGLVTREPFPGDARGLYTVLTAEGLARLRAAAPIHLAGIRRYWLSKFTDDELTELGRLFARLEDE